MNLLAQMFAREELDMIVLCDLTAYRGRKVSLDDSIGSVVPFYDAWKVAGIINKSLSALAAESDLKTPHVILQGDIYSSPTVRDLCMRIAARLTHKYEFPEASIIDPEGPWAEGYTRWSRKSGHTESI